MANYNKANEKFQELWQMVRTMNDTFPASNGNAESIKLDLKSLQDKAQSILQEL